MIVTPYDITSTSIVIALNVTAITCYSILLVKIKGIAYNDLFVKLTVMLLVSLLFYSVFVFCECRKLSLKSTGTSTDEMRMKVLNTISSSCFGVYYALFCSAHWIFAMKYWMASYMLGEGKKILLVHVFYYFVLALNVAIPVFVGVAYGINKLFPLSY